MFGYKKLAFFIGGTLFGSAGVKVLSGSDAKKAYIHTTAATLRAKECIMNTVTSIQENAADILASAKDINEQRALNDGVIEDTSSESKKAD